jgi:hypothetical protein
VNLGLGECLDRVPKEPATYQHTTMQLYARLSFIWIFLAICSCLAAETVKDAGEQRFLALLKTAMEHLYSVLPYSSFREIARGFK